MERHGKRKRTPASAMTPRWMIQRQKFVDERDKGKPPRQHWHERNIINPRASRQIEANEATDGDPNYIYKIWGENLKNILQNLDRTQLQVLYHMTTGKLIETDLNPIVTLIDIINDARRPGPEFDDSLNPDLKKYGEAAWRPIPPEYKISQRKAITNSQFLNKRIHLPLGMKSKRRARGHLLSTPALPTEEDVLRYAAVAATAAEVAAKRKAIHTQQLAVAAEAALQGARLNLMYYKKKAEEAEAKAAAAEAKVEKMKDDLAATTVIPEAAYKARGKKKTRKKKRSRRKHKRRRYKTRRKKNRRTRRRHRRKR